MFDPQTLIAVVCLLAVILALCTLGLQQTLPRSIGGLRCWSASLFGLALAASVVILVTHGRLPASVLPLAGLCYVGGAIGLALAMRRFTERPTPWRQVALFALLAALPAPASRLLQLPLGWSQMWLMLVMSICCLVSLDALLRSPQARQSLGGRLLIIGFAALLCSTRMRIVWLFSHPPLAWLETQHTARGQLILMFACAALLLGTIGLMLMATDRLRRMLEHLASHDALTGLLERNGFRGPAEHSLALARRRNESVACLLCDIDHFKQVNDDFGHPAGDAGLVLIASILSESARASDLVSRYGGEEFALLLPNCSEAAALRFAERVRAKVEATPLNYFGQSIDLTISMGVSVGHGSQLELETLYRRADRALYAAKRGGRNKVCSSAPEHENIARNRASSTNSSTSSP